MAGDIHCGLEAIVMQGNYDFFVDGGTLRPDAPSYVTRSADHELLQHALGGNLCYILTARQMGKSSLMLRTAKALQDRRVKTVLIDLTTIYTDLANEWYPSVLIAIIDSLKLQVDVRAWWNEHQDLSASQRLIDFLHDVVLQQIQGSIAVFIDEIDTTLSLNFRNDFFAAIRAVYNLRASDSAYMRLTFVLLGVATPTALIQDRNRTPFNIGREIVLQEFSYADAEPLRQGLETIHPGQGDYILRRIFYWTNGHPYLTQKLCLAAAETQAQIWDNLEVDKLVEANFFSEEARDPNLAFVRDRIWATATLQREEILNLYNEIYNGKTVLDDNWSPAQDYLKLSGLVCVEQGKLHVCNRIYWQVFRPSVKTERPRLIPLIIIWIIIAIVTIVLAFLLVRI
jgi:AAA-like domain